MRVAASANSETNTTTASIAPSEAAAKMFCGIIAERISATPGTVPVGAAPPLSAATACCGIGARRSSSGTKSADIVPLAKSTITNRPTARRARTPPPAAASVCDIPV